MLNVNASHIWVRSNQKLQQLFKRYPNAWKGWERRGRGGVGTPVFGWRNMWTAPNIAQQVLVVTQPNATITSLNCFYIANALQFSTHVPRILSFRIDMSDVIANIPHPKTFFFEGNEGRGGQPLDCEGGNIWHFLHFFAWCFDAQCEYIWWHLHFPHAQTDPGVC